MKIILSLVAIVATAFLTHHFFISRLDNSDREVAAFSERNNAGQIKWEHQVAGELASNKDKIQASVKPNWQDQLAYEFFKGQYDISAESGQIQKISLQKSADGVTFSADQFMEKFGHQIKNYSTYKKNQTDGKTEIIDLFDNSGLLAGSFHIIRNDDGRVVEFVVK
ncbi:MAG: hypothetical protein H7Z71_01635 [Moraxellaceae bacterium]|nr:hypothetical protein [Pseudobdellovibrionaceae bacterium]